MDRFAENIYNSSGACSISAVMAVYNPKQPLSRIAVEFVLCQSLPVIELIPVDVRRDQRHVVGVPGTLDILRSKYEEVPLGAISPSGCCGQYIPFLDQDDFWYLEKFAEQAVMLSCPGAERMLIL